MTDTMERRTAGGTGSSGTWSRIVRLAPNYAWLALAALAGIGYGINWLVVPHTRETVALGEFMLKIAIFMLAIAAVSSLPGYIRDSRFSFLLLALPSLAFLGYIIPRMFYWFLMGPENEPAYYTLLWNVCYPAIVLSICLAYRLGGASFGKTFKVGANSTILLFSGYLEYMWFVINPLPYEGMKTIPHIEVLIGFKPSHPGLLIFFACHIPLFIIVNLLPIDRWLENWSAAARRTPLPTGKA
jgi:hypothetical protein